MSNFQPFKWTSLNLFQRFAVWYWGADNYKSLLVLPSLILVLVAFFSFINGLPWSSLVDPGFDNYFFEIFAVIISLFGFGIAFIGSQSIQYSIIKITIRYYFLQFLLLVFALLIIGWLFPSHYTDWILLWFEILLFLHTIMLIDKVYDPEELIVEVIVPMIFYFDDNRQDKEDYIQSLNKFEFDIGVVDYSNIIQMQNPELAAFLRSILRLVKSHSFRPQYFLACLVHFMKKDTYLSNMYPDLPVVLIRNQLISYSITELAKVSSNLEYAKEYEVFLYHVLNLCVYYKDNSPDMSFGDSPPFLITSFNYLQDFSILSVSLLQFVKNYDKKEAESSILTSLNLNSILYGFLLAYVGRLEHLKTENLKVLQEIKFVLILLIALYEKSKLNKRYIEDLARKIHSVGSSFTGSYALGLKDSLDELDSHFGNVSK